MKFKLYTDMALVVDLPADGLRKGDIVKLVDHHVSEEGNVGYSVEALNALGDTIAVACVWEVALAPLSAHDVLSVRPLVSSN